MRQPSKLPPHLPHSTTNSSPGRQNVGNSMQDHNTLHEELFIHFLFAPWCNFSSGTHFLGPRGPLVPPGPVAGWTRTKNLDQLYSYINHHRTTANLSDIVWCMSGGVWIMSGGV